ncbi:uncharacterized protein LOC121864793, partial [Homarus americanus]|uniref:uncharacterized protein LOC121864793 n=1 Tax=Homarus americanus TaxID=6706 RepID=UPI001C46ECEA
MANYKTKRRPLSCEVHLSVIQEEELESLRKRREWMESEKHKGRRSKSESDGDICDRGDGDSNDVLEDEVMAGPQQLPNNDDISPNDVFSIVDDGDDGAPGGRNDDETDNLRSFYTHLDERWLTSSLGALSIDRHNSLTLSYRQLPFDEDLSLAPGEGPRSVLRKTNSLDYIKPKGNSYIRRAMPFLSRMTSNLKRAVSEKDLLKLTDFSVATSISPSPRSSPTPHSPTAHSPTARSPTGRRESAGSPGPASRHNSNSLRQCDSLENICDTAASDHLPENDP